MNGPVFVTARFRTGSTLLWHLLRQCGGFTTYYEPCHDNLLEHVRGDTPVHESHLGVTSYWDEYRPLLDELTARHRNDFGIARLMLGTSDEWPELESYFRFLIDRAAPLHAVLQMNRVDFRLPWLRTRFPDATIVHLFRNPREQWLSMTKGLPDHQAVDPDENTSYDLVAWAVSLSHELPFLVGPHIQHGYERHYLIWKLSYLMGSRCADVSLSYNRDVMSDPERGIGRLLERIAPGAPVRDLLASIQAPHPPVPMTESAVADCDRMEKACDRLLDRLGLLDGFGRVPLIDIRTAHGGDWHAFAAAAPREAARLSGVTFSRLRSRYLNTVSDMRRLGVNARNVEVALAAREEQIRMMTAREPLFDACVHQR